MNKRTISELVDVLGRHPDPQERIDASWHLKKRVENGPVLTSQEAQQIGQCLSNDEDHWEIDLHLLQILPAILILGVCPYELDSWLERNRSSSNKFCRAWAYNGYAWLGQVQPSRRDEVASILAQGAVDQVPSVKARLRRMRKEVPWLKSK